MKYLKVRIASGTADSVFDIFYNSPTGVGTALLYDTGLPAVGIVYDALIVGEGITVSVPDNATSIVLDSSPSAFCTTTDGVNDPMFTIPIGCISYTVSASMGSSNYYYTDCDCIPVTATIDATYGYTEQTFCALQDTVNAGLLTVVDNGDCSSPPATATLYFDQYYIGEFYFGLSIPISASITIRNCGVTGYNEACSNSPGIDSMSTYGVINVGDVNITVPGSTPLSCDNVNYLQANNISVNNTSLQNGDTITIGGTLITIVINRLTGCSGNPYTCL